MCARLNEVKKIDYMQLEDVALTFVPQLGVRGVAHLLECFGSAEAIFSASVEELRARCSLREDVARNIVAHKGFAEAERELEYCHRNNLTALASTDEKYPKLLRQIDDYPHILYVRGRVEALQRRSVAFVGTRKMSPYGERVCNEMIHSLAEAVPDVAIVSGLAYGIDGAAHRAALAEGVTTVGVIANPLPNVTPAANERLAAEIVGRGGAIVTELCSQTKQNGRYFIPRNRIIAGLSAGVVVVESPAEGGSLSTAEFADGYGRSVMAVPGRVTDENSRGCNVLIRNRKAQAVLSGRDIVAELMWELDLEEMPAEKRERQPLTTDEERLLACFDSEPTHIDTLLERSGMSSGEVSLHLMTLELSGAVRPLRGGMYEKLN